ncbi:MAG: BlaI/MecI/CopY family transcriptional regulator [Acidobacteriota bacterium]|nr:BlaI/MecI/CopY family transcriptional regulator [Acidobacteriota bacterium]
MTIEDFSFSFQPHKDGLGRLLGELEARIMERLWESGNASVRQVHSALSEDGKIAYTTVMTVMTRLAEKGLLERQKDGKSYVYAPSVNREQFAAAASGRIFSALLEDWGTPALSAFVDSVESTDPDRMAELARLIQEKRKS